MFIFYNHDNGNFPRFFTTLQFVLLTAAFLFLAFQVDAKNLDAFQPWLEEDLTVVNERTHFDDVNSCVEDKASLIYFKKFILLLFNRRELHYDTDLDQYERSLVLSLNSQQLEKLEQLQDPRNLDMILADIFKNIRLPNRSTDSLNVFSMEWWPMLQNFFNSTEVHFILMSLTCLLIVWYLHRYWHIYWYQLFFGICFIGGYIATYYDCNQELKRNQMKEVLGDSSSISIFSFFNRFSLFSKSSSSSLQGDEFAKLLPSTKVLLPYCRPDHVLARYISETFTYYTKSVLEESFLSLQTMMGSMSFPYNMCAIPIFFCTVQFIIKLLIKNVLAPNVSSWRRKNSSKHDHQCDSSFSAKAALSDRLSGENLKILLETINVAQKTKCSGIEDIKDPEEKCLGALRITEQRALKDCDKDAEMETSVKCQEICLLNAKNSSFKKDN